jgi:hypothetical protein
MVMKKLVVLFTLLFAFTMAKAQPEPVEKEGTKEAAKTTKAAREPLKKLEGIYVSPIAKENFAVDYSNASNAQWYRGENFDEVTFSNGDRKMTAFYDIDGNLVGTTESKTFADIPLKAQQKIKEKYGDYETGPVIFFDDNETNSTDMILWSTQFDDEDNYFVEMNKGTKKIILEVDLNGGVSFFKEL